jgi:hypothetical protein
MALLGHTLAEIQEHPPMASPFLRKYFSGIVEHHLEYLQIHG